jgi:hypothetical protein
VPNVYKVYMEELKKVGGKTGEIIFEFYKRVGT